MQDIKRTQGHENMAALSEIFVIEKTAILNVAKTPGSIFSFYTLKAGYAFKKVYFVQETAKFKHEVKQLPTGVVYENKVECIVAHNDAAIQKIISDYINKQLVLLIKDNNNNLMLLGAENPMYLTTSAIIDKSVSGQNLINLSFENEDVENIHFISEGQQTMSRPALTFVCEPTEDVTLSFGFKASKNDISYRFTSWTDQTEQTASATVGQLITFTKAVKAGRHYITVECTDIDSIFYLNISNNSIVEMDISLTANIMSELYAFGNKLSSFDFSGRQISVIILDGNPVRFIKGLEGTKVLDFEINGDALPSTFVDEILSTIRQMAQTYNLEYGTLALMGSSLSIQAQNDSTVLQNDFNWMVVYGS